MRGMIYLPGLDELLRFGKYSLWTVIIALLLYLSIWILPTNSPARIAEQKARAIAIEEIEQAYRQCIRNGGGMQELQRCKDQFLQDYR